ncbi:hypothetical protein H6F98_27260 [Microcoleus sp. FACHB-SPT15]|uniref:DUF6263 family protein n=1 Tax=Microcoleus sp. FACHB-SPT15 TaxID=2692830 RepID=UPI001785D172|nr:DUF6263 family protein [Microcoleus sp. FACHB-SPT15]MBD1809126.1 hypothetical protein [Microcoleus sp. FACHB-SPT15]
MKKILFASSVCLFLTGGALKPVAAPVSAQTPFVMTQTNNPQTSPATPTQQVELLSTGAEPRQELRFAPPANTKQTVSITTTMDAASSVGGQAVPKFKIPTSVMKMDVTVTQVDPNGDIHLQFAYTDADVVADSAVPPELLESMRSTIQQLVGLNGTYITDNRGQVKSGNFDLPEGSDPITEQLFEQLSNSLDQFSSPVPAEAIGKGAKWRVTSSLNLSGINLSQTTVYELVDLQDNVATINVTLEQNANTQNLTLPGTPAGADFTLKSLSSQGQGQMIMPLNAAMPSRSNVSISSNNEMSIKDPNSKTETTLTTQLSMQMALESQFQQ